MDLQNVTQLLIDQKRQLQTFGLRKIGIFGSLARGQEQKTSDVDLLLDFEPSQKNYKNFFAGVSFLERLLNRSVDAVTPQAISPYLKPHIDKDITYVQISN